MVRRFPCRHIFHTVCIDKWLECCFKRTCPFCYRSIENMQTAHEIYRDTDCGGATRQQIIGFENVEYGPELDYEVAGTRNLDVKLSLNKN